MWVFTPDGYVSAVEDKSDPTTIVLRSRDYASLKAVAEQMRISPSRKIKTGQGTDYPYRMRVSREQFAGYCHDMAMGIWYTNFKDAATKRRGKKYHDVLLSIWSVTHRLTPKRVKDRERGRHEARWSGIDRWFERYGDRGQSSLDDVLDGMPSVPARRGVHSLTDKQWIAMENDIEADAPPL